ncbi:aminopeptidase N isoform X2 [Strongylocentrotus purpuratus]|uniref:Aminopeptidase n=1 Tax=Strongylocentrotus purpuratus TaxID=7668 RepID=A0A7M7LVS8_STRPU|nr:aminopeptidase N isoform X2 [Strongylocentrotus purpuratus]
MPGFKEKHTFRIQEDEEDDKINLSLNQVIMIGALVAALVIGVGLLCFYIPDRSCGQDDIIGVPTSDPQKGKTTPRATTEGSESTTPTAFVPSSDPQNVKTTPRATTEGSESTTSTASPSGPWPGRLTTAVMPESYELFLKPYIYDDDVPSGKAKFTFDGIVTIRVRCNNATNRITLHAVDITIHTIKVFMVGDTVDMYESDLEEKEYEFLHIELNDELVVDGVYDIEIDYLGQLNAGLSGFYRTSYLTEDGTIVWGATSQMQPTSARKALPCFDEPAFRAVFNTTIVHRSYMAAITNGIEIDEEDLADEWTRTTYLPTPKMPTYLLAFTVGTFDYTENITANGVRFRAWSRPEAVNNTRYALETGSEIITYFEDYFGIPFPLEKQDMIAVPDFAAGAMENWGLIIYRETAMLYDPEVNSASNKQYVAVVVSHELAHQWFGNLVTPKWWDDLWLNEGFASYVEYLGVDFTEPTWGMKEQFVINDLEPVFELDSLGTSHPVRVDVGAPAEINEIFDSISYNKGGSILRMLNNILTEEVFTRGLTAYLKEHAYGNADSDDLWSALTEADKDDGGLDVKAIMDTWTLQMGYPLVTLERTDRKTVTAHQEHYLSNPSEGVSQEYGDQGYLWQVYIQYTDKTTNNFIMPNSAWMEKDRSIEFELADTVDENDWYMVNTYQYGFYRVNYDHENWMRLTDQLMTDHKVFPNENRAQLIDDAFSLARTGNISMETALNLTRYLGNEKDLLPWEATLDYMSYITNMFRLSGGFGPLELYMQALVEPLYDSLGWNDTDEVLEQYNRNNAIRVACYYRVTDCLDQASKLYQDYMQNPDNNPISNNLKTTVYCNGIRDGGQTEWEFGWNKYLSSSDSSEKSKWLSALGCSRQPWILNRYLMYTVAEDTQVRSQDVSSVLSAVGNNHVGIDLVWDFLRNDYDKIYDLFATSIFTFSSIISAVPQNFNTEQLLEEWIAFGEGRDFGPATRTYEQGTETIKINIQWMEKYEDSITEWLMRAL